MLEKLLKEYYEKFNEDYPLCPWADKSEDEIIDEIELCIETGLPAEEPEFDDDCIY